MSGLKGDHTREVMAFCIVAMFGFALYSNPRDTLIVGALIASFSTAIGFYLGGSKTGSDTATKNADTVSEAARTSPQVQPVTVVNDQTNPVPVEPA